MSAADATKLTVYFSEQARGGGRLVADALLEAFERHALATSVLLRGIEGFGLKHHLHTQRLENLALDLPAVAVAVDREGLVTLERARLLDGEVAPVELAEGPHEETKLTVYCGRGQDYPAVVDLLQRHQVDGATVLLGVDGTVRGRRRRAGLLGGNGAVPLMLIAVGAGASIGRALGGIGALVERPQVTLERIRVCKRDGVLLAAPEEPPDSDRDGRPLWQKLMVHTSAPIYPELVRRLRAAGAGGATTLRGSGLPRRPRPPRRPPARPAPAGARGHRGDRPAQPGTRLVRRHRRPDHPLRPGHQRNRARLPRLGPSGPADRLIG